jgi:Asp-tRNA(Asn)/Glu-tRNA(Gln) amidotransferase A subunit family amidase
MAVLQLVQHLVLEEAMLTKAMPLAESVHSLQRGDVTVRSHIRQALQQVEAVESTVEALLPEEDRLARLLSQGRELEDRYPSPEGRPPLYGILVGVKDIFHAEGLITRAGTALPPELFAGAEAAVVGRLRRAGALILGKTVTTEFAYFEPGPTRNPHNPRHTPGGSSSGSAAAVAAGYCELALGTQTVGSTIRPASYCGIVGFKPSFGRISTQGVVPFSTSADHVGLFTADAEGMAIAAAVVLDDWPVATNGDLKHPVLGVPIGPYLDQTDPESREAFTAHLDILRAAGYEIRNVPALDDISALTERHECMIAAEMALVHQDWFQQYQSLYRPRTAALIRQGREVGATELKAARASRGALRSRLHSVMDNHGIHLWVTPGAPGPAPEGIQSTGNPAMQLPWTHAGMPAMSIPAGLASNGLPLGIQVVARFGADDQLLRAARALESAFQHNGPS